VPWRSGGQCRTGVWTVRLAAPLPQPQTDQLSLVLQADESRHTSHLVATPLRSLGQYQQRNIIGNLNYPLERIAKPDRSMKSIERTLIIHLIPCENSKPNLSTPLMLLQ
jgi:hypothetical protein